MGSTKVNLRTSDGVSIEVEETVALEWLTTKQAMEDHKSDDATIIPLPEVSSDILLKVIEYTKKHLETSSNSEELDAWDAEFLNVDVSTTLYNLLMAVNYLNIPNLVDLICRKVADMIAGNSVEKVRTTFKIISDYTEEEEEKIRQGNPWAFESREF